MATVFTKRSKGKAISMLGSVMQRRTFYIKTVKIFQKPSIHGVYIK
jgi:hypothetical protein